MRKIYFSYISSSKFKTKSNGMMTKIYFSNILSHKIKIKSNSKKKLFLRQLSDACIYVGDIFIV